MKNIGAAIEAWYENDKENVEELYGKIKERMNDGVTVIAPIALSDGGFTPQYLKDSDENTWCVVFTDMNEIPDAAEKMLASCVLKDLVLQVHGDETCNGIAFNVWGKSLFMDREAVESLLRYC